MSAERVRGGRRVLWMLPRRPLSGGFRRAGLTASGLLTVMLIASSPNVAAGVPLSHTARIATGAEGQPASAPSITVLAAPANVGLTRTGEPLSVRVTMTNSGETPTAPITLSLSIDGDAPIDADRLGRWLADEPLEFNAEPAVTVNLDPLAASASAVIDLVVPVSDSVLSGDFGARAAVVRASADGTVIASDRTALVWLGTSTELPVARTLFISPISTPGLSGGLLSGDDLARLTSDAGSLTGRLEAVAGRPVVMALDPRLVASIRLLGTDAPASALDFLDRLSVAPNETMLLPWADADPLLVHAATGEGLPVPEGGDEAARAWPVTVRDALWLNDGLTDNALSTLKDAGTRVLIAPSSALSRAEAIQEIDGVTVLRADDSLARAAHEASTATSQQLFDRAMSRLSALTAVAASSSSEATVVIPLSRTAIAPNNRLRDTITGTFSLPWTTAGSAALALNSPSSAGSIVEHAIDAALVSAAGAALRAEAADRSFAQIALDPAAITDLRRLELLAALSVGWGAESANALQQFVAHSTQLRSGVQVAESSAITLLADRASLPVTVKNNLAVAVRVFVHVQPDTTQLRVVNPRVEVVVEPQSQTRALVPVESLTNGQVAITVTLRDENGTAVGESTRVSLNLQAGWETAGTIAVAAAIVLLLGIGIGRDIRKRRRVREAGAA